MMRRWQATVWTPQGNVRLEAGANTKSEARAAMKRHLGIGRKGRLPVATELKTRGES